MPKYQLEYLKHIQDEIGFIIKTSKMIKKEAFQEDEVLKRGKHLFLSVCVERAQ